MKLIDISLRLTPGYQMRTPEGVKNVQLSFETIKDYPGGSGQYVSAVHMRLHNGTHVDAPQHFVEGGPGIDDMPLETFFGDTVLLDLTRVGQNAPIRREDVETSAEGRPRIEGKRVLLRTGWNRHYGEAGYQEGSPYISAGAVDWIVSQGPVLVGYDYMHGKPDPDAPYPSYALRTFLEAGIVTMGYLRNLDLIDAAVPIELCAFPLAFVGVESSPVRAVVIQK